jgi:PST family polysaccharide transporter
MVGIGCAQRLLDLERGFVLASVCQTVEETGAERNTYGQILKSSALVGGSQVLNIAIGIVRAKAMALLLGPAGVGLFGLYGSISSLAQSIAGMGVNSSGVRQIAEAVGSGDKERISRTAVVLRRTSVLLGLLGAVLLVVFARQISNLTFGNDQHSGAVSLLSIAVFFTLVSWGQGALIQGMRRISDLAKMGVLGAFFGTLITIPLVYFFREQGVVPSLIGVAAMTIATSWWYSRKVQVQIPSMTASQIGQETAALLKLGFAFMASGLMMMGSAYLVRTMVLRSVGLEGTGMYQAAWTLGGLYVGFILQAMGADFYPRLTASAHDDKACNRMVNEQARIGLLLAGPGVIATLTFAPLVIGLFYSAQFEPAVGLLRWICLGVTLRVITWPMGFIILAKGRQNVFFWSELAWTIVHVGLAWVCLRSFGLNGAGVAFFGSYVFHGLLIYPIVSRINGFHWSRENKKTVLLFLSLIGFVFCGFSVLPILLATCLGAFAVLLSGAYSMRVLLKLVTFGWLPDPMRRLLVGFGVAPSI